MTSPQLRVVWIAWWKEEGTPAQMMVRSAPRPPVAALTASVRFSREASTVMSAPSCFARASRAAEVSLQMIFPAPRARRLRIVIRPIGPVPMTAVVSPGVKAPFLAAW